jgi:Flp pilus assembly protein TadG
MSAVKNFIANEDGGPAAEFALVLPLALLFLFGIIDTGRYMWEYNQAEKATQMGARFAVATDVVASGLTGYSFAISCGTLQGEPITQAQFPGLNCQGGGTAGSPTASCSLAAASSCSGISTASNSSALGRIVTRMRLFKPDIAPANVRVSYGFSGLGYAGDPNGLDVAPQVTVRVTGLTFQPLTTILFNSNMNMGPFSYSLTMEDGSGTFSN